MAASSAVVALESAVIRPGLPKPAAMDAVQRQWEACEKAGATPAVIAVFDGQLRGGLTIDECATLADRADAVKVSPWNLAAAIASPGFGGSSVAASLVAPCPPAIRVLSTWR